MQGTVLYAPKVQRLNRKRKMPPNSRLLKATLTGALGGLIFGFDTVLISGALDALVNLVQ